MFFWNSLAFSVIRRMLAIWSLVPLPFLNPAWHLEVHGSRITEAWFGKFWALLYLRVRWVQLCSSLSILWHCLSLGLEFVLRRNYIFCFNTLKQICNFHLLTIPYSVRKYFISSCIIYVNCPWLSKLILCVDVR